MLRRNIFNLGGGCFFLAFASVSQGDSFIGVGGGIKHTAGPVVHLSVPVYGAIETHYAYWQDGEHDHALGLGYRFDNGGPISGVLGFAYLSRVTENLLHKGDAYFEIRWRFHDRFSCQVGHYSMIGDDAGENFLTCGMHFSIGPPTR